MFRLSSSSSTSTLTVAAPRRSVFLQRVPSVQRNFSATMTAYKPNTEPPKSVAIFKNVYQVASDNDKFRRVLWTGRNSQVGLPVRGRTSR